MSGFFNNPGDTSANPSEPTTSRTRRLQNKIRRLQEQIHQAEIAVSESSQQAGAWANETLRGQCQIPQAPLEIVVRCYQSPLSGSLPSGALRLAGSNVPHTVVSRRFLHDEIERWGGRIDLSPSLRHLLLMIFLVHQDELYFGMCIPRLENRITLPPTDPEALHPCLVYAICLGACVFAGADFSAYEALFRERTREYLDAALSGADRMEHFMWASIILGWYWIQGGEHLPAHAIAATVGRWAIACGLQGLPDPTADHDGADRLLGPLRDNIHFAERVNLWWAIYMLDRKVGIVTGLAPSIQEDHSIVITTSWPRDFDHVERHPSPNMWRRGSIQDLFIHGTSSTTVTDDSIPRLKIKSAVLLDRACWVSRMVAERRPGDAYWTVRTSVENALLQFQKTMPDASIIQSPRSSANSSDSNSMFYVRTTVLSAFLRLYMADWENDAQTSEKALFTVSRMVDEIRGIPEASFAQFSVCIGDMWFVAGEVCIREIHRNATPATPDAAIRLRNAQLFLDVFVHALAKLTGYFPVLISHIRRLSSLLFPDFDTSQIVLGPLTYASAYDLAAPPA